MPRIPQPYFILLFVGLSMVTAVTYHQWRIPGEAHLASEQLGLEDQVRELMKVSHYAGEEVENKEVNSCQCVITATDYSLFSFDEPESCSSDRQYFSNGFEQIPLLFNKERASSDAEFPRICVTYIMKSFLNGSEKSPMEAFSLCPNPAGRPVAGAKKHCVSERYVNVVYNAFADVASCMRFPQKDYLPKLLNESGMHMNAWGEHGDTGISQLTGAVLSDANEDFSREKKMIMNSDNPACQRLKGIFSKLNPVPNKGKENRCLLMTPPENPFLSLFYMGIKHKKDHVSLERMLKSRKILELFARAGLSAEQIDMDRYYKIMGTLAYNAGATAASDMMVQYLKEKISHNKKVTLEDFDFGQDMKAFNERLKAVRAPFQIPRPENSQRKMLDPKRMNEYESAKRREFVAKDMTFPQFLRIYQTSGAPGYLSFLFDNAKVLNTVFKEGTCVPESYLSL
ncbi:MAG: hypothetical protein BroJett040_07220 [Oligoflexia bacterium]|nr:MAG: hypothetical protein BroJett040_07220 [Oligoflexia bacterium]